jgi:hypothetical protein
VAEERRNKMADEIREREDGAAVHRHLDAFADWASLAERSGKISDGKEAPRAKSSET